MGDSLTHPMRPVIPRYQNKTKQNNEKPPSPPRNEKYRLISFVSIDAKIFKKNTSKLNPATNKNNCTP